MTLDEAHVSSPIAAAEVVRGRWQTLAVWMLVVLHVVAVSRLVPLSEVLRRDPLVGADHAVHSYNVHTYREALCESGLPWGCDPTMSAGKWMLPLTDAGGRPQAVLCAVFGSLGAGFVVRFFLFAAALTYPIWHVVVARWLGLPATARVWGLFTLLAAGWLYPAFEGFFRWGQAAFATAGYMCPFVLMLLLRFVREPRSQTYVAAAAGGAVLFLMHVLGPVVLVPSFLFCALAARPLGWPWRAALGLAPVLIAGVNSFWFVPFVRAIGSPEPPGRGLDWMPPDLTYRSIGELAGVLSPLRVTVAIVGLLLAVVGFGLLRRHSGTRTSVAFALAAFTGLFLKFGGSFLPVIHLMQPSRFLLPALALLSFPAGLAAHTICTRLRIPQVPAVAILTLVLTAAAGFLPKPTDAALTHVNYAGVTERHGHSFALYAPGSIPLPNLVDPLIAFVQDRTQPQDRLLIQTVLQAEPLIVPMVTGREVISNTYPDAHDLPQFLRNRLFGRRLGDWSSESLRETLDRWGVQWAFTYTDEATRLLAAATGDAGEPVGRYRAFRVLGSTSRFLVGSGRVVASVNRLELSELRPTNGVVVLRYRFHPAWRADGCQIEQYPVPEDPVGFIALKAPPESVTLRFDPWLMLRAPWPNGSTPSGS